METVYEFMTKFHIILGNKCLIQIFISILSFLYIALRAMYIILSENL